MPSSTSLTFVVPPPKEQAHQEVDIVVSSPSSLLKEEQDVITLCDTLKEHFDSDWVSSQKEALEKEESKKYWHALHSKTFTVLFFIISLASILFSFLSTVSLWVTVPVLVLSGPLVVMFFNKHCNIEDQYENTASMLENLGSHLPPSRKEEVGETLLSLIKHPHCHPHLKPVLINIYKKLHKDQVTRTFFRQLNPLLGKLKQEYSLRDVLDEFTNEENA